MDTATQHYSAGDVCVQQRYGCIGRLIVKTRANRPAYLVCSRCGQAHGPAQQRIRITEAQYERMIDRRVLRALREDRAYLQAEEAEAQTAREEQIEANIVAAFDAVYEVIAS